MKNNKKITLLEAKSITKKYRSGTLIRTIFDKVSFTTYSADLLAIIGKSGSGKTLMIQTILGLEPLDSGEIKFQEQSISEMSRKELEKLRRNNIALILREDNLFSFLTINENLNIFIDINDSKDKYNDIVTLLDLDSILEKDVNSLEWLEYQKVSLAISILKNPDLIIMDEPTGNMTKSESDEFIKILKDINKKTGIAMLVFTHDSSVAVSLNKVVRI